MKLKLTLGLAVLTFTLYAQTIRRVNNIPGINVPYATFEAAVNDAVNGDIIMVEGSQFPYLPPNVFSITKKISIVGPGYLLDQNPGLQANTYPATIANYLSFDPGSEGSSIKGMTVTSGIFVNVSNITISYNRLLQINLYNSAPCSNLIIHSNLFDFYTANGSNIYAPGQQPNNVYTNILVSNNIFNTAITLFDPCFGLFVNNHQTFLQPSRFGNLDLANNVLYDPAGVAVTYTSSSIQNNIFCGTGFQAVDPAQNNKLGQDLGLVYSSTGSEDGAYILKAGSPAIGAGLNGTDDGPFGGTDPYRLGGIIEGAPAITSFLVPASVPQNATLNVKVSAKSN